MCSTCALFTMWLFCELVFWSVFSNIPLLIEFVNVFVPKLHKCVFLVTERAWRRLLGGESPFHICTSQHWTAWAFAACVFALKCICFLCVCQLKYFYILREKNVLKSQIFVKCRKALILVWNKGMPLPKLSVNILWFCWISSIRANIKHLTCISYTLLYICCSSL